MRKLKHPARENISLMEVFHALSDPVRAQIVRNLAEGREQSCGGFGVPLAKSTLSHHFKVLREAGITRTRIEGTHHLVSLRQEDLEARFPGLLEVVVRAEEPLLSSFDPAEAKTPS